MQGLRNQTRLQMILVGNCFLGALRDQLTLTFFLTPTLNHAEGNNLTHLYYFHKELS